VTFSSKLEKFRQNF